MLDCVRRKEGVQTLFILYTPPTSPLRDDKITSGKGKGEVLSKNETPAPFVTPKNGTWVAYHQGLKMNV
jgi:hypothetical protein